MNICIGGCSGFIGQYLTNYFQALGHHVMGIQRFEWDIKTISRYLDETDVLLNFVGEPIQGLWTKDKKRRIFNSRVENNALLARALSSGGFPVKVWINASAVGIYDDKHVHDESSVFFADNFMADVVRHWEEPVLGLGNDEIRCIVLRLGIVLGKAGGIIEPLQFAGRFKTGFDIKIERPMPFIHIHDLADAVRLAIGHPELRNVVNAVSPEQVSIKRFFDTFNDHSNRWITIPIGETWIKRIMGESAILFTGGQHVVPMKLMQAGFVYNFPDILDVMKDICYLKPNR